MKESKPLKFDQKAFTSQCEVMRDCTISVAMLTITCAIVVFIMTEATYNRSSSVETSSNQCVQPEK